MAQLPNTDNGDSAPSRAEIADALGLPESDQRVGMAWADAQVKYAATHDSEQVQPFGGVSTYNGGVAPPATTGTPSQPSNTEYHGPESEKTLGEYVHDVVTSGHREVTPVKIGGNEDHSFFNDYLPTASGELNDVVEVTGTQTTHHGLFGDTTTTAGTYIGNGHILGKVQTSIEHGVETVTVVQEWVPGSINLKVGDTRTVPAHTSDTASVAWSPQQQGGNTGTPQQGSHSGTTSGSSGSPITGDGLGPTTVEHPVSSSTSGETTTPGTAPSAAPTTQSTDQSVTTTCDQVYRTFHTSDANDPNSRPVDMGTHQTCTSVDTSTQTVTITTTENPGDATNGVTPAAPSTPATPEGAPTPGEGTPPPGEGTPPPGGSTPPPGGGTPPPGSGDPPPPGDGDPTPPTPDPPPSDTLPAPDGPGPGTPTSTPTPDGEGDGNEGSGRPGPWFGHGHGPGGGGGGDGASEGPDGGSFTGRFAGAGNQHGAEGSHGSHLPNDPGEEMPNPEDIGGGNPTSNVAHGATSFWHQAAIAVEGERTGLHLSTTAASEQAGAASAVFNMAIAAHDVSAVTADASAHAAVSAHEFAATAAAMHGELGTAAHDASAVTADSSAHVAVSAHDFAATGAAMHGELGTATFHDATSLGSAAFATQMHV